MKRTKYLLLICIILFVPECGKRNKEISRVPLEQVNLDKSTNYNYIFKDVIEEQRKREDLAKKDPFKD